MGAINMLVEFPPELPNCLIVALEDMTARNFAICFRWALAFALAFSATCASETSPAGSELQIGGASIEITFDSAPSAALRELLVAWIAKAAQAVDIYYGRYPVSRVNVRIRLYEGHGARSGHASGWNGPEISVSIGKDTTAADLANPGEEWLMTHEMVHLAFPSVAKQHHWIEEGLATYVEPVARVRAGELTPRKIWGDMLSGMPQGLPAAGDRGLDHTATWGRTYWGGALFCLLADIEIRQRTNNRKGLEDALRGILDAGGSIETEGELTQLLDAADAALGVPVMRPLYERMKATALPVDLPGLWRQLGVEKHGDEVLLRDDAPLAAVRKAITQQ
jgi:hypothetical protein